MLLSYWLLIQERTRDMQEKKCKNKTKQNQGRGNEESRETEEKYGKAMCQTVDKYQFLPF